MIIGIVAIAKNYAIGKNGKLPWYYSADLKFFKQTTLGNVVVMGRKTFDSIGKPLSNRQNIVLSRTIEVGNSQVTVLLSKTQVLDFAKDCKRDVFIIGGASIYQEFADIIEKWIVTEVPEKVENADAFMAKDFLTQFELIEKVELGEKLFVKYYQRINKI